MLSRTLKRSLDTGTWRLRPAVPPPPMGRLKRHGPIGAHIAPAGPICMDRPRVASRKVMIWRNWSCASVSGLLMEPLSSWPSWISARARSHSRLGPEGHTGHLITNALAKPFSISSFQLADLGGKANSTIVLGASLSVSHSPGEWMNSSSARAMMRFLSSEGWKEKSKPASVLIEERRAIISAILMRRLDHGEITAIEAAGRALAFG